MIKTFRGLLADEQQITIRLGTNQGLVGYRIVKFQAIAEAPGTYDHSFVVKIYKREQDSVDALIDFDDQALIGALQISKHENMQYPQASSHIVVEHETFNQDIFVTCKDIETGQNCNYYIELQQIKLDQGEAAVATLKDMRGTN